MSRVCITGASGFVGRALTPAASAAGFDLILGVRSGGETGGGEDDGAATDAQLGWQGSVDEVAAALTSANVHSVIHLAGMAHDQVGGASAEHLRAANADASVALFNACQQAKVARFIWLSSIKVLGETSAQPLTETAPHNPQGAYALSKAAGEVGLQAAAHASTDTQLIILRPPLVYGPGVSGNMLKLFQLADSGFPLPFGAAHAPRTMVANSNLVSLLLRLLNAPAGVYHAGDASDLSVCELLQALRATMQRPRRLLSLPEGWVRGALNLLGKGAIAQRLLNPLQVSTESTQARLDWAPPLATDEALREAVHWYLTQR